MKMKKDLTELVFILDKSGSMSGLEEETIHGFNNMLNEQKASEGECRITTVLFNHQYNLIHDRIDIQAVNQLTRNEYAVSGYTALMDAIGTTINKIKQVQSNTALGYRADKVVFVIITDGYENASREFSSNQIKALIEEQKKKHDWEFIFLGANIDAVETARQYGINADRAANYAATKEGTSLNFMMVNETVLSMRKKGQIDETYLDEIRKYYESKGGEKDKPSGN